MVGHSIGRSGTQSPINGNFGLDRFFNRVVVSLVPSSHLLTSTTFASLAGLGTESRAAFIEFEDEAGAQAACSSTVQIFGLNIGDRMCSTKPSAECKSLFLYTLSGNPISTETE